MSTKRDFGQLAAGGTMLLLGAISLWKAAMGFLYGVPIYFKGPSWLSPWQALVAGGICFVLGLYLSLSAFRGESRE